MIYPAKLLLAQGNGLIYPQPCDLILTSVELVRPFPQTTVGDQGESGRC